MEEKDFKALMEKFQGEAQPIVEKAVAEALKGAINSDQLEESLKGLASAEQIEELNTVLEDQGLKILNLEGGEGKKETFTDKFNKAFEDKSDDIDRVVKNQSGSVELITVKAVGDISTGNVTTSGSFSALHELINADDITPTNLRQPWVEQFATVTRTGKATYSYAEYTPGEGDADFIAEAGTKPQIDIDVTTRSIAPVKVPAYVVLSEEARDDIPQMESQSRVVLARRVALKRQNGILFGDGTGSNPKGLDQVAKAFDPASWDATQKVKDPNLKDVAIACANQIYTTHNYVDESNYIPNLMVLNPADYHAWLTRKDANNNYLFMNIPLAGGTSIEGINVIHHRDIVKGKVMVGDFTKLNIINYIDYALRMGWVNDQFIKNQFTMLGESRFFTYVRNLDEVAFIYDDIANVVDGIKSVEA